MTKLLKPTEPGGVSTLGAFINTAADNLRGQGANIRDVVIKLSQTISALGDHSDDIFTTFKNLSTLVSALHDSADLLEQLNQNLAAVTSLMADDPQKVGSAVEDLSAVIGDVQSFADDNREAIGTTSDKLAVDQYGTGRQSRRPQADAAHRPDDGRELLQHLRAGQRIADRGAGGQQLRQPDQLPLRRDPGGVAAGRRAVGETVRAVPGADRQEPAVQLPADRREPPRRRAGPTQRGHLQRGLDAPRLRAAGAATAPLAAEAQPSDQEPGAVATDPAAGLPGDDAARRRRRVMMTPLRAASWCSVTAGRRARRDVRLRDWRGLNSLPMPGTQGGGPGSFMIQAQLPDVNNIQPNSRVRVGDVTVGTVTKIERQGWHALVTMRLNGDVDLPENATAKIGLTSLLGSLHIELAPPADAPPKGRLHDGSLIPLSSSAAPTRAPSRPWPRCRWCSTAADSVRSRTSPRRSAPRSAAASRICAA